MMRSITFIAVISVYCSMIACGSPASPPPADKGSDTSAFFSLDGYIRSQVEYVDLRNFPISRTSVVNGKKDSAAIDKDGFKQWAQVFLDRCFTPAQKPLYKETVFEDLSTGSYTLNYSPYDPEKVTVKNLDILLNRETNMVKRIFIKSFYNSGDTAIEEQCSWKADKSFRINRVKTIHGQTITELNYINWDENR